MFRALLAPELWRRASMVWLAALCVVLRLTVSADCIGAHGNDRHGAFPLCHASVAPDNPAHDHAPGPRTDDHCPWCGLHHCCDSIALTAAFGVAMSRPAVVGSLTSPSRLVNIAIIGTYRPSARGPPLPA